MEVLVHHLDVVQAPRPNIRISPDPPNQDHLRNPFFHDLCSIYPEMGAQTGTGCGRKTIRKREGLEDQDWEGKGKGRVRTRRPVVIWGLGGRGSPLPISHSKIKWLQIWIHIFIDMDIYLYGYINPTSPLGERWFRGRPSWKKFKKKIILGNSR